MDILPTATCETIEAEIAKIEGQLAALKMGLAQICDDLPASRALSIARTNLETGVLWLEQAAAEFRGQA